MRDSQGRHLLSSTKVPGASYSAISSARSSQWFAMKVRSTRLFRFPVSLLEYPPGMALAPWNVLAAGKIRSDAEEERREQTGEKGMLLVISDTTDVETDARVQAAGYGTTRGSGRPTSVKSAKRLRRSPPR